MSQKLVNKNSIVGERQESINEVKLDVSSLEEGQLLGFNDGETYRLGVFDGALSVLIVFNKKFGIQKDVFDAIENCIISKSSLSKIQALKNDFNELSLENQVFKYKINILTSFPNKSLEYVKNLRDNCRRMIHFKKGDIIGFKREYYHHAGVFIDEFSFEIVHRNGEPDPNQSTLLDSGRTLSGFSFSKAKVMREHLIDIMENSVIYLMNEKYDKTYPPKHPDEIVKIALSKLGEEGYNITQKNCQHFATDCRNGVEASHDLDNVMNFGATVGAVALVSTLFGLVLGKTFSVPRKNN